MQKQIPIKMEKLISKFQRQLDGDLIQVCDLGSCQYNTANIAYTFILSALTLSRELFEKLFQITYDKEPTESEFIARLQTIALEQYNANIKDYPEEDRKSVV